MATSQIVIPGTEQTGTPTPKSGGGFFSKIGTFLRQNGPAISSAISEIGAHLAAAGGNYVPIELERQQRRDLLQQQLAQSSMDTANLNRQFLLKQYENYETPAQREAGALRLHGAELEQANTYAKPTDIVAPMPEGGLGHYNQRWNPQTKQFETSPTMVGREVPNPTQAMTMPPVTGTNAVGPQQSPTPAIPPPIGGIPLIKPAPTVTQQQQLPAAPIGVAYSPAGIDMDPNSPTYGQSIQYVRDKAGNNVKTVAAPAGRGTLDVFAPTVSNAERSVQQPTGEITKESFKTERRRVLSGQGGAGTSGGGGSASSAPGNLGAGKVIGGHVPKPVEQAFANVQDARNRLQVMQRDIEQINANPTGNTGSMDMDLLSQHVALTFGTVKNARGGEALIMEHIKSRSVPEEIGVLYNRLKSGGVLSPEQRQNFVHLAQSRLQAYQDQYTNAQKEAQGCGSGR